MVDMYLVWCEKCRKKTKHVVLKVNRKRGLKLICFCGNVKNKYYKLNNLEKNKIENEDE